MTDSLELPIEVASHRLLSSKEIKAVKTAIEGKILKLNILEWTVNLQLNVTWLALSKVQPMRHEMSELPQVDVAEKSTEKYCSRISL